MKTTLNTALPELRRPFTPEAVRFKVQSVWPKGNEPTGCLVVGYIDARLVIERLNTVAGGDWAASYERFPDTKNLLACYLTVFGRTRTDVGESSKGHSKDLYSDALKRAAVHFGVGISVYALKQPRINFGDGRVERRRVKEGMTLVLADKGHDWLRDVYARWLEARGIEAFGEPLAHGDEADNSVPEDDAAPTLVPVNTDRSDALLAEIEKLYGAIRQADPRAVPPGQHARDLDAAKVSHEALEQYAHKLAGVYSSRTEKAA